MRAFVGLLVLSVVACKQADPDVPLADALSLDGLLIVDNWNGRTLLDPATGRASTVELPGWLSIAPDLERVVHRKDGSAIEIAGVSRAADGTPAFTAGPTLDWTGAVGVDDAAVTPAAFTLQGDRISGVGWWNPDTGEHVPTGGHETSPDGRHHTGDVGEGFVATVLYDDATMVMPAAETMFTNDGQWLVASDGALGDVFSLTHVPSRSTPIHLARDGGRANGWLLPTDPVSGLRIPYAGSDALGRLVFAPSGNRGSIIISEPCGFVQCYRVETTHQPLIPITRVDPTALVEGRADATEQTPTTGLDDLPMPADAVGYAWRVLAITPDGERALLQRRSYRIGQDENVMFYVYVGFDVVRVDLGGSGELTPVARASSEAGDLSVLGCPDAELFAPDRLRMRRAPQVRFLNETDFLCGDATAPGFVYEGGVARPLTDPGSYVALDGQSLVGPGPDGLCQEPIAGGFTACIPDAGKKYPIAQIGLDLVPRVSDGPVVAAVSHRAATPGTTIHVVGYGFGDDGAVRLGDQEVPSSSVVAWSDRRIVFTMPEGALTSAPVIVTSGGATSAQRHLWLGRTEAWPSAPVVPDGPFEIRQGVNRVSFPGAGAYTVGIRSLDQIFPGEEFAPPSDGAGADHVDFEVLSSPTRVPYPWITFRSDEALVFRPLVVTPGLPEDPPWQPVGETALGEGNRLVWTAGILHQWQLGTSGAWAAALLLDHAAGADWRLGGLPDASWGYPKLSYGFYDGDTLWQSSGSTLRPVTGWGEVDATVRYPLFGDDLATSFDAPITGFGVHDAVVVVQLQTVVNGQSYGAVQVSVDGGDAFTEVVAPTRGLWTAWSAVSDGARPGIYGTWAEAASVPTLARVTPTGTIEVWSDVPAAPAWGVSCPGGYRGFGAWVMCHDSAEGRLYAVDVDAGSVVGWEEVGGALAGHLTALAFDGDRVLAGTDTGEILASYDLDTWVAVDTVTWGPIVTPLPIYGLGVLEDGGLVSLVWKSAWSNAKVVVRSTAP